MKPVYKSEIMHCRSSFEAMERIKVLQQQVSRIIESNEYKRILDSEVPLYVYLYANPDANQLEGTIKYKNGVHIKTSEDIADDFTIFAISERLGNLSLPQDIDSCLIILSTKEINISNKSNNKSENDNEDTPLFIAQTSDKTFDDLILSQDVKTRIFNALAIIQNRELIFDTWNFKKIDKATKSILCFYGPAGTGKTETAKAIGNYLGKKIIFSTYAQIESQYVGVGAKNLHAVFKAAEEQNAILFFDEADSFLSNRLSKTASGSDKHYNRMSNELFQLLETFNGCVIFATNLLTDVDKAFKSRIIDSIKFELPNEEARKKIISLMIPQQFPLEHPLTDEELNKLVDFSDGFSGREIKKAILLALSEASVHFVAGHKKIFNIDDILCGFEEVKRVQKEIETEIEGIEIDPKIGQELLDKQIFNEKLVSMAKLALNVENPNDEHAIRIYKEISQGLLGVASEDIKLSDNESIANVCADIKTTQQRIELLDIAIKVLAADGSISEKESVFLNDIMNSLSVPTDMIEQIKSYATNVAQTNAELITINNLLY